jgi:hypothetical protein
MNGYVTAAMTLEVAVIVVAIIQVVVIAVVEMLVAVAMVVFKIDSNAVPKATASRVALHSNSTQQHFW